MVEFQLLLLLLIANGLPVFAGPILGSWNYPIDGGLRLPDRHYLFGPSKSIGGILLSLLVTPIASFLLGLGILFGLYFAAAAMAGDLLSSFCKRRLRLAPSTRCYGIDQIPESLLPLLVSSHLIPLQSWQIIWILLMFFVTVLLLSRLLFQLKIKNRPY